MSGALKEVDRIRLIVKIRDALRRNTDKLNVTCYLKIDGTLYKWDGKDLVNRGDVVLQEIDGTEFRVAMIQRMY